MRLEKAEFDTQNTRSGDEGFECSLQGGQQALHERIVAVRLAEHPQAQQDVCVVGLLQRIGAPLART